MFSRTIKAIIPSCHTSLKNCSSNLTPKSFCYKLNRQLNVARVGSVGWKTAVKNLDPKQVEFYHSEQLIKVDSQDKTLGSISKGESHSIETVRNSIYHRALSLLIFDEQDRFLLTQRASCKITFPNYYTNACCSHPLYEPNEMEDDGDAIGVKRATIRRAKFELGIESNEIQPSELKFVNRLAYRAESDGGQWGESEVDYIFILRKNVKLTPNPDEVQDLRYVTKREMQQLLVNYRESDVKITPWVRLLARDFLFLYWDNLNNLDHIAQPDKIVHYEGMFPVGPSPWDD